MLRTERVLEEICRFMGVEYTTEMLDYPADAPQYPPPDPALVTQWKTGLSPRDVALVERRTAGLLERRGYAPSGHPLPAIGPLRHDLLLAHARVRRLRTRVDEFGPKVVAMDVLGRRLRVRRLAAQAQQRINRRAGSDRSGDGRGARPVRQHGSSDRGASTAGQRAT